MTRAQKFFENTKVKQAKETLLNTLKEHQAELTGIQPPQPELKTSYEETLKKFGDVRSGGLFYPYLSSGLGRGALVELDDGSVKYDFIGGIGVHLLGHSHPKIIAACLEAALKDTVMQGNLQQDKASYEFSELLLNAANKNSSKLSHVFLTSSGVMAGENALKITFQKKAPADRVFVFDRCFMGRTLALSQFTDKPGFRDGLPVNYKVDYIPFFDANNPKESTEKALNTIRHLIKRYPNQHAAMCFELVQGEGGFYPGTKEFFTTLMTELRKNNIAILIDEVQTFARTSELFAFQHFGLDELVDVVWIGKSSQVCATLYRGDFKPRPGLLSQTYTSSSTAIHAGKVIIEEMLNGGYYGKDGKNCKMNQYFSNKLDELAKKYPEKIKGPYGIGAMVAFTPLDGSVDKVKAFVHKLFENGVIGFMAGANPARARFLLPVAAITEKDIDEVVKVIEKTLLEI